MIRFPKIIIVLASLVFLASFTGAEAGEGLSDIVDPDDIVIVDIDLNITYPGDDSGIGDIDLNITNPGDDIINITDPLDDILPNITIADPSDLTIPENLTFHEEHSGVGGFTEKTSTIIESSPSIFATTLGLGSERIDDAVPDDTKQSGEACTAIITSIIGQPAERIIYFNPSQQPSQPGNMRVSSNQFLTTTMIGVLLMAFASIVTIKPPQKKALPFLVPMYSRISRDKVLENETRGNIYHLIARQPGMDLLSIKNALGLTNGVLAHHIHTLEREKYLRSIRDGRYRRFFIAGTKVELVNSVEKLILWEIQSHSSINQSQIAKNIGLSRQALNYHIKKLVTHGSIITEKMGRETICKRRDN